VEADWAAALHLDGQVTLHAVKELFGAGTIATQTELVDVAIINTK
jgi:hypothetical protein